MSRLLSELLMAIVAFVSTNVDDLLLLASLFADADLGTASVVAGQFIGMSLLVFVSMLAAHLMVSIPLGWAGFLGFFPLGLGIARLAKVLGRSGGKRLPWLKRPEFVGREQLRISWLKSKAALAALLTVANGGDNLSVYVPLFALQGACVPLYVMSFGVMTAIWCWIGYSLTKHSLFRGKLKRHAEVIVPWVLILLGVKIVLNGVSRGA
jgi:cadmium resistance protein CadD (predicted permease)